MNVTREEAINNLYNQRAENLNLDDPYIKDRYDSLTMAIRTLEEPTDKQHIALQWAAANDYALVANDVWRDAKKVFEKQGIYESRQEKRQVSETMDAILYSFIQYLTPENQERVRRALEILHIAPIKDGDKK